MANPQRKEREKNIESRYNKNDLFIKDNNLDLGNINNSTTKPDNDVKLENLYNKNDLFDRNKNKDEINNRYSTVKIDKKPEKIKNVNDKK
jgi:hypothetical protein